MPLSVADFLVLQKEKAKLQRIADNLASVIITDSSLTKKLNLRTRRWLKEYRRRIKEQLDQQDADVKRTKDTKFALSKLTEDEIALLRLGHLIDV